MQRWSSAIDTGRHSERGGRRRRFDCVLRTGRTATMPRRSRRLWSRPQHAHGAGSTLRTRRPDDGHRRHRPADQELTTGSDAASRLVSFSGLPYTIVRPGWFDYHKPDEHRLVLLQGDRRQDRRSSDGVIAGQIAEVLVASLTSDGALRKTRARRHARTGSARPRGATRRGWTRSARCTRRGPRHANMPLQQEPQRRGRLDAVKR